HEVLASWCRRFPRFTLLTQNVDGLHEAACSRDQVQPIRLHGSIWHVRCARPCRKGDNPWRDEATGSNALRRCPPCDALVHPPVVWFGEALDPVIVDRAVEAATNCDVFLAIGTSAVVYPAAGLLHEAKRHGAFTIEINPAPTSATSIVDLAIAEPAEVAL